MSSTINARVDDNLKKQVVELLEGLGLDMSTAINMFLRQILIRGGIPFDIRMPNADTLAAIEEVEKIKCGKIKAKSYNDVDELFADLESESDDEV